MPNTHFGPDFLKAKAAQRVVHLGSLHFKAKPQEIEAAAQAMLPGAQCAFYWLALPADYSGEHKGWCEVAFEDVDMANRALAAWTSLKIRGRLVKAQRPRTTGSHTSPTNSGAGTMPPPPAQPRLSSGATTNIAAATISQPSISRSPVNSHNVESSSSSTISDRWRMSVREMDILASEKRQVFQDKPQVVQRMKETFIQRNPEAFIVSATRDKAHARAQKSSELGPSIPLSPPLPITAQAVTFPPPLASTQSHGQLSASNWDDFGHLEYPKEWIYDPENPGANVLSLLVALEKVDVRYGSKLVHRITLFGTGHDRIPLPAIVISPDGPPNEQGKSFFEMKRVVDPGKPFSETSSREWCEEGSYKGVEIVTVPQSGIKAQRALGFELCRPPVSPLDPANKDRDRRAAPRVEDTMTLDRPWADTELYMPRGCELLRKQQTMGTWAPVKTLDQIPEAQASSLSFSSFRPAGEIQKLCPATFVGHTHKYPRPNGVGAGWGGYDKFALWQSFGRHVDPSLVEEEDWETDPAAPLHLVSDEGVVEMVIPSVYRKDTSEEPPMSLYEKLHRDKSKWRGGSTADRGRCRGAQRRW